MPESEVNEDEQIELVASLLLRRDDESSTILPKDNRLLNSINAQNSNNNSQARRLLYLSHSFAQFSDFAWQFGMTIVLASLSHFQSLALISSYGFVTQLAVFLLCPKLGVWLDRVETNRLSAARRLIVAETLCVWMATACCCFLLASLAVDGDDMSLKTTNLTTSPSLAVLIVLHVFGAAVQVFDQGFLMQMERDWIVVMSRAAAIDGSGSERIPDETTEDDDDDDEDDELSTVQSPAQHAAFTSYLSDLNVTMKQIDLTCKVVGPALAGVFLPLSFTTTTTSTSGGLEWACLLVGLWNTLALMVEYWCTTRIFQLIPMLASKDYPSDATERTVSHKASNSSNPPPKTAQSCVEISWCRELQLYMQQPIAWQGLALALLYCNSLTFGNGILTTYLLYRKMNMPAIGLLRGFASAIGLLGTCAYHISVKYMSLGMTGLWSILYECTCLGMAYVAVLVGSPSSTASLVVLIIGVCASRIGLWVFDIAVTQLQQECIPDGFRLRVGGVQTSLNAFCTLISFTVGFLVPDPTDFHIFVAAAFISVALAAKVYAYGMMK